MTTTTATPSGRYPARISATIDTAALKRVTNFFNGTLHDMMTELFQNARRAGATEINVDTDGDILRIRDNGNGIPDPTLLLRFGGSEWAETTSQREDPAGMGLYSIAGTTATITTRTDRNDPGWAVTLKPHHYRGESAADVRTPHPATLKRLNNHGTEIAIDLGTRPRSDNGRDNPTAKQTVEAAALHLPVAVRINGIQVDQTDYLASALAIKTWKGLRIGVGRWNDTSYIRNTSDLERSTDINFFGQQLCGYLPVVTGLIHKYTTRIDVVDCPMLQAVLPARREIVTDDFTRSLRLECERTILRHLKETGEGVPFPTWKHAKTNLGIKLPTPEIRLAPWHPAQAEDNGYHYQDPYESTHREIATTENLIVETEKHETRSTDQLLKWAMDGRCAVDGPRVYRQPRPDAPRPKLFMPEHQLRGYEEYDAIPRITKIQALFRNNPEHALEEVEGTEPPGGTGKITRTRIEKPDAPDTVLPKVETIVIRITIAVTGETNTIQKDYPIPFAFTDEDDAEPWTVMLTKDVDQKLTVNTLTDILTDGFYHPNDLESDPEQTIENFRTDMQNLALTLLSNDDERRRTMLAADAAETAHAYAPRNRETTIKLRYNAATQHFDVYVAFSGYPEASHDQGGTNADPS